MKPIPASQIRASETLRMLNPGVFDRGEAFSRAVDRHGEPVLGKIKKPKQPNKTEARAKALLEASGNYSEVRYEAITLRLANRHAYTPDLLCIPKDGGKPELVEVKNAAYKHASYGRSRMAFDQAKIEWGWTFDFHWMTKTKDGWKFE